MFKKLFRLVFLVILVIAAINIYIDFKARDFLFDHTNAIPDNTYALVLGTSKYVVGGGKNSYFESRMKAAEQLLSAKKVDTIIVSGDNREENYNEPKRMKQALIELGVPEGLILEDKSGTKTDFSIRNFKTKYPQQGVTIVTQKFHNQRAVYTARKNDINAVGFNADDIGFLRDKKTHMREWFAKVKAFAL